MDHPFVIITSENTICGDYVERDRRSAIRKAIDQLSEWKIKTSFFISETEWNDVKGWGR